MTDTDLDDVDFVTAAELIDKRAKPNGGRDHQESDEQQEPPPRFIDMSSWDTVPVPPRDWAVLDRIPLRQTTLFSGEGAVGKSIVLLQLSSAHVLARDWLGTMPEPGAAIYLDAEDDQQ